MRGPLGFPGGHPPRLPIRIGDLVLRLEPHHELPCPIHGPQGDLMIRSVPRG